MNKEKVKKIFIEIAFCVVQLILSRVSLFDYTFMVGTSFALVRLFFGHNIIFVAVSYFISKLFLVTNLKWMLITGFEIIILSLFYFSNEYFKIKNKWVRLCVFIVLARSLEFYFSFSSKTALCYFFIGLALSVGFVFYFYKLFVSLKNKFLFFKFSSYDYLIFSVIIFMLSVGLFQYEFLQKYTAYFFVAMVTIFSAKILQVDKAFVLSGLFSLGAVLDTNCINYLIIAFVGTLLLVNFKELNKYIYGLVSVLVFGIFVLVFRIYDIFTCVTIYVSIAIYFVIPKNIISKCESIFENDACQIINNSASDQKVFELKSKLSLMGETLLSMKKNFKFLMVGNISREGAAKELTIDIINGCCKNCSSFRNCFLGNIDKKDYIQNLLLKAIENKKISSDDFSNGLMCYCNKSSIMQSHINQLANQFLSYEKAMKSEDESKLIVASELENFSDIFLNFSKMVNCSLKTNSRMSKKIKETFTKSLIDAKEVEVFENETGIEKISAIITNSQVLNKEILEILQRVTKIKMEIKDISHLDYSGISLVNFVPSPKLRIDFAISTKAKEQKNGDNVSVSKIGENKFFVALTDGMGHGENANRTSMMVLSLVKSMFEVGLDSELILESINKLLLPAGLDNFSTLDACVIDLDKAKCEFIKLGSSVSILKHSSTSEIISCESLPIGIVQNLKPTIVTKNLFVGDMIFIASDGIVDTYSSVNEYKSFINDSKIYNLQSFTDSVIEDSDYMSTAHKDDMTIIAINLLKN